MRRTVVRRGVTEEKKSPFTCSIVAHSNAGDTSVSRLTPRVVLARLYLDVLGMAMWAFRKYHRF